MRVESVDTGAPQASSFRVGTVLAWLFVAAGFLVGMLGIFVYTSSDVPAAGPAVVAIGFAACINGFLLVARGRIGLWVSYLWPLLFAIALILVAVGPDLGDFVFLIIGLILSATAAWYFYRRRSQFKGLLYTDPSNRGEH